MSHTVWAGCHRKSDNLSIPIIYRLVSIRAGIGSIVRYCTSAWGSPEEIRTPTDVQTFRSGVGHPREMSLIGLRREGGWEEDWRAGGANCYLPWRVFIWIELDLESFKKFENLFSSHSRCQNFWTDWKVGNRVREETNLRNIFERWLVPGASYAIITRSGRESFELFRSQ